MTDYSPLAILLLFLPVIVVTVGMAGVSVSIPVSDCGACEITESISLLPITRR